MTDPSTRRKRYRAAGKPRAKATAKPGPDSAPKPGNGSKRLRRFTQAGALVAPHLRAASASRGFAEGQLLTRWEEVCGADIAAIARPLKVGYARGGFGATLTVACDGARATEVQMMAETIRTRVNACYGYNAISRVRIAQDDQAGFAERQAGFRHASAPSPYDQATAEDRARVVQTARSIEDASLRAALEALGTGVIARARARTKPDP